MNNKGLPAQAGFTLIELLFAIALSALFLPAMVFVFSFSLGAASQGESYTQAYALAQEKMETIYYLKDGWMWEGSSPTNTEDGEYYQSNNDLELGTITSSPQPDDDGYTVTTQIKKVYREDTNGDGILDIIESGSIVDPYTRKVVITVSWNEKGEPIPAPVELVSYVTKH